MSMELEREVQLFYRRTIVVMAGMALTILVLLALNLLLSSRGVGPADADYGMLRLSFTVIVLFLALSAISLRRFMFRATKLQTIQSVGGSKALLAHLSKVTIILAALAEAVSVAGFIFGRLTNDSFHAAYLILVGAVILIFSYPRRRVWLRAATLAEGR